MQHMLGGQQKRPAPMHHQSPSPHTQGRYQLLPGLNPRPGAQSQRPAHPQSPGDKSPGQRLLVQVEQTILEDQVGHGELGLVVHC